MKIIIKALRRPCVWETLFFYLVLLLIFYLSQKAMPLRNYGIMARQSLIPLLGLFLVQYLNKRPLFSRIWLPALFVGASWFATMPLLYHGSVQNIMHWSPRLDMMWGIYLMLFSMLLQSGLTFLRRFLPTWLMKLLWGLCALGSVLALLIPLAELGHTCLYGVMISDTSILAIQDTYLKEAAGYLETYIGPAKLTALAVFLLLLTAAAYRLLSQTPSLPQKKRSLILLFLFPIVAVYTFGTLKDKTLFFKAWHRVTAYQQEQQRFTQDYAARYDALQLDQPGAALSQSNPGTVLIVIGESASRDYMKTYTPSFPYDDTPWLESCRHDKNFIVFNHAYSCFNQTVEALMRACTEMSQYNDDAFNESITFVDIARKAGYHTYWFSNQGGFGENDAPITLIMKTAEHYESPAVSDRMRYDGDLLPLLKEVPRHQNNFIVIHLIGSHAPYQERYPKDKARFDASTPEGNYANAVAYTDDVLQQIFTYAQKELDLKVMLYFSDHGENVYHGHNPDVKTFDNVRIPMFLYLSPDYRQTYPQKYRLLASRADAYFTNDMVYNTLCGLLNAPSNHYDAKEDFSSPSYSFTRDDLWTFKHTVPISEDTTEN
ncbi:phosphoethanolamine transferase [uncultured Megasphaera sp.]|uniref:phosphoethanolamine transferase n=1 Tax=uncultured Megasphaera sp. TaxID=165188 RepID=UPI0025FCF8E2|nr:sulfatase-like hydrolase/transferase [uncultured Megasphaera sp.]